MLPRKGSQELTPEALILYELFHIFFLQNIGTFTATKGQKTSNPIELNDSPALCSTYLPTNLLMILPETNDVRTVGALTGLCPLTK